MVSGSKLKNPSKVSGDSPISLYYSLIYGNCLGNVVMGWKNVEKCVKMCWRPVFYILLWLFLDIANLFIFVLIKRNTNEDGKFYVIVKI